MVKIVGTGYVPPSDMEALPQGCGGSFDAVELTGAEKEGAEAFKRWKEEADEKRRQRDLRKADPVD